ncbi:disease resistance protein RPM1-like [Ziziphus jujuba]|uniref:Disease resistance protein RPM1-like n=1 Tax=Ziziphus jujuba TaxID=326968 RepID=A0A6P3YVK8_ZIZJJ|nr:disease resistance protein RPM1-like [Ziziphus jujuba]
MAETLLTPVISKLFQLLAEEAKLFKGVRREVRSLTDELDLINCFLKDAEAKSQKTDMSESLKTWLKQIRELADQIENVMDEYVLNVSHHRNNQRGFTGFLQKTAHLIKGMKPGIRIAHEIQSIKSSLLEIKLRGETYGLRPLEPRSLMSTTSTTTNVEVHDLRVGSLFLDDSELVGIDSTRNELVRRLVEGESTRMVFSIVGEGGIGKTTLAKKVYDNEQVKERFDCHVWVTVSQSYNMVKLLTRIATQIRHTVGETHMVLEELIDIVRQYLLSKRYVFVFDDVWDIDFWAVMKHALPSNNKGSRIIITTRNDIIAASCKETSYDLVRKLKPFSQEMAWELFTKIGFRSEIDHHCPPELQKLSLEIVRKCQGLPLVIATVAGLLSTKEKVVFEWQKLHDSLTSELVNNPRLSSVAKILSLSYNDLPYHLKSCFLYFCIFPEDFWINNKLLHRLWIAEGFIKEERHKKLEQVAEEYLNEFIYRNLVQTWTKNNAPNYKMYRVHDLMREIILSRADEISFCRVWDERNSKYGGKCRRLSIHSGTQNVLKTVEDYRVRSIFLFDIDNLTSSTILFKKFKLLKVLHISSVPLGNLPKGVGNLVHMKYLSLRNTNVKKLPRSIGKLHNLQTLDLRNTYIREIPVEINKLQKLQHLFASFSGNKIKYGADADSICGVRLHGKVGCLKHLRTLRIVEAHDSWVGDIKELEELRHLRSLGISNLTTQIGRVLCASIEKMNNLERLNLYSISEDEILDLQHISSPPPFLGQLLLMGQLQKLPHWILKLQNLSRLTLNFSKFIDDPLKHLKCLPNLVSLKLYQAYDGEQLHFEEGSFPKLKMLDLGKLDGLKLVRIDGGELPLVEELFIGPSPLLEEVPSHIQLLRNLKLLKFCNMPREFVLAMQPVEGRDYWKIKHVPSVHFWYRIEGEGYKSYKLGESDLLELLNQ